MGTEQLQRLHQVPCDRCIFCTGDYRLKCTVHPITAFSESAINCPDFQASLCSSPSSSSQIKSTLATD